MPKEEFRPLESVYYDTRMMKDVLEDNKIGKFDQVDVYQDIDYRTFSNKSKFFQSRTEDDLLLVYFSGHGYKEDGEELQSENLNYPVINVSWYQAKKYCTDVSKRLPSEKEWIIAVGAFERFDSRESEGLSPVKVFSLDLSEDGVYDLLGNAREWVSDSPKGQDDYAYVVRKIQNKDEIEQQLKTTKADDIGFRCATNTC